LNQEKGSRSESETERPRYPRKVRCKADPQSQLKQGYPSLKLERRNYPEDSQAFDNKAVSQSNKANPTELTLLMLHALTQPSYDYRVAFKSNPSRNAAKARMQKGCLASTKVEILGTTGAVEAEQRPTRQKCSLVAPFKRRSICASPCKI